MNLINREELKEKLDRGDDFKLVMALGDWQFRAKHIPGSLNIHTAQIALEVLDPDDEIVVYCSSEVCSASKQMYSELEDHGYRKVRRLAAGVAGWEEAGYPLEGEWVK